MSACWSAGRAPRERLSHGEAWVRGKPMAIDAMDEPIPPGQLSGRCNCGAVTFVAAGPFRPAKACHCRTCRRQSGHFIAATQTDRSGLSVSGEESLAWYSATPQDRKSVV